MNRPTESSSRLLTWKSGGWVLAVAAVMVLGVCVHRGMIIFESMRWREGHPTPAAYATHGFDLSTARVPASAIVPSGNHRDYFKTLDEPDTLPADEAEAVSTTLKKVVANAEVVVGVTVGGESRAYPIRILAYHEIINDTLGGVPIAVTYSPICYGVVVFDRRHGGETLEFGYSGLLHQTNLLLYDRRDRREEESLWCQLQGRALAGPAAASDATLQALPSQLLAWQDWRTLRPDTTVVLGKPSYLKKKIYGRDLYGRYYFEGELKPQYPVEPKPQDHRPPMTQVLALRIDDAWQTFLRPHVEAQAGADGRWETRVGGRPVTFHLRDKPATLWVTGPDGASLDVPTAHAFWFAWYALEPAARQL